MTQQDNNSNHSYMHSNPILDTFKLVAETQQQISHVTKRAQKAVKTRYKSPEELVLFIEEQKTPVYQITGFKGLALRLAMMGLGYESGFISPPNKNIKNTDACKQYQNLCKIVVFLFGKKPDCSFQKGLFLLPKPLYTVGFIAHQLHHWLAFLAGLPGYSAEEQEEFRYFMGPCKGVVGPNVETMSIEQIESLRNAIHREVEALKFIKNVTDEIFRPLRQSKNITGGIANA